MIRAMSARTMSHLVVALGALVSLSGAALAQGGAAPVPPTVPVPDFRTWVYIGGGLFSSADGPNTRFSNVFVEPTAYAAYMKTGTWPDGTVVYSDKRRAITTLPITANAGWGQTGDAAGGEVEIKDAKNRRWMYYQAGAGETVAKAVADQSACTTCHTTHAAVDSIFVQFYPTLVDAARSHGTFHAGSSR